MADNIHRPNLRLLAIIRLIVVAAQCVGLVIAYKFLQLDLAYPVLAGALLTLAVLAGFALWRAGRPGAVGYGEFAAHLVADVALLTLVLYLTGGSTNPFVSYYLVPLTISAALLPWRYTWGVASLCLAAYTALLFFYQPLTIFAPATAHASSIANPHILGMWINFLMSTLLITYFVVKMARELRRRERQLHQAQQQQIRDQQIMALATMAAGTAHELGTPLSTVSVILDEFKTQHATDSALLEDIGLIESQLERCKQSLRDLVNTAERNSAGPPRPRQADVYVDELVERWCTLHPATRVHWRRDTASPAPDIAPDPTLDQALTNLMDNAADASPERVDVGLGWNRRHIDLSIRDYGSGVDGASVDALGRPFVTTKTHGLGVGLFLAEAAIARRGGALRLSNHPAGGAVANVRLPVFEADTTG